MLAMLDGGPSQILAVDLEQVEGAQDSALAWLRLQQGRARASGGPPGKPAHAR